MFYQIFDLADGNNVDALDYRALGGIARRNEYGLYSGFLRRDDHRQNAVDSAHEAVERNLADKRARVSVAVELFSGAQQGDENRQVIQRSLFFGIGWGEIDSYPTDGKSEAYIFDRSVDAAL